MLNLIDELRVTTEDNLDDNPDEWSGVSDLSDGENKAVSTAFKRMQTNGTKISAKEKGEVVRRVKRMRT